MAREWRWALSIVAAFAIGATCAQSYARLAAPGFYAASSLIADLYPWKILTVEVANDPENPGVILRLTGEVRRARSDVQPGAVVYSRVHVGAVIETPLVFWTLLIVWPVGSFRRRIVLLMVGIPIFLTLEVITTVCQLLGPLAWAAAVLGGDNDPVTAWDHWSRFLEAGGRFVLEIIAALFAVSVMRPFLSVSRPMPTEQNLGMNVDCYPPPPGGTKNDAAGSSSRGAFLCISSSTEAFH